MPIDYLSILIFILVIVGFSIGTVVISSFLGKKRPTYFKCMPYECGIDPVKDAQTKFEPKFYLVCLVFLLFDIELVFLYPFALISDNLGLVGLIEIIIFIFILFIGYLFAWKLNIFNWIKGRSSASH
ncbi:MAG: NADH-quinone oxidoreductase subunit A [Candidatus Hydrogenedentota bacterium]